MHRVFPLFTFMLLLNSSPIYSERVLLEKCKRAPPPVWMDITGCNKTECTVYDKKFVKMTGELKALEDAHSLTLEVGAYIWAFRLARKIPADQFDVCQIITQGCPLKKGNTYSFVGAGIAAIPFAGTRMIEAVMRNENKVDMMCFKTRIRFERHKHKKFLNEI